MKTVKLKECCPQMKKEAFKGTLIKLYLQDEVNGVIKDDAVVQLEIIREMDISSNLVINYCPFCGTEVKFTEETLKKKF